MLDKPVNVVWNHKHTRQCKVKEIIYKNNNENAT
jgi:hypothetical protein